MADLGESVPSRISSPEFRQLSYEQRAGADWRQPVLRAAALTECGRFVVFRQGVTVGRTNFLSASIAASSC